MTPLLADSDIVDEDGVLFGDGGGRWDRRRFLFSIIPMARTVRSEKKTDCLCQSCSVIFSIWCLDLERNQVCRTMMEEDEAANVNGNGNDIINPWLKLYNKNHGLILSANLKN
ncbi:hypothetical protein L1987_42900 [Smallanthus sonchifolius]|uniref:Uncharacterized protein n=1 Tax=Smallanthus sonchifolius TaxID=185202 RepID=A0ACB9GL78_9ASTR|nr:hypothetical protein L1987_42900 [Smallanthus sonchifolius]